MTLLGTGTAVSSNEITVWAVRRMGKTAFRAFHRRHEFRDSFRQILLRLGVETQSRRLHRYFRPDHQPLQRRMLLNLPSLYVWDLNVEVDPIHGTTGT